MDRDASNPLNTPEILRIIGPDLYFSLPDAIRVSKLWHATLMPVLWKQVPFFPDHFHPYIPSLQSLRKHASLVQTIMLSTSISDALVRLDNSKIFFPNLSYLTLHESVQPIPGAELTANDRALFSFIQRHRSVLKEVIMDRVLPLTPEFVEALASCSYLEKVSPIPDFTIQDPEEWISLFERLWSRIRVLSFHISPDSFPLSMTSRPTTTSSSLSSSVLANPDSVTSSSPAPLQWRSSTGANRIRDLEVYTVYEMYATLRWILEQCPELVRFSASIRLGDQWLPLPLEDLALMADLAEMIGSGRSCLRLEDLSLPDEKFQNDDFSSLMNAMHRLTALNLSRTNFNLDSWRILQSVPRHVFTIRNLNLHGCMDLPGAAMQDILCSMPNLEVFYSAEGFFDTDLLEDPRPWACSHRLQDLQLILGIRSFKTSYPTVYSYLAGLTKIENLTIWTPMGCSKSEVFQLHLKQGLDQMRTLGRTLLYLSLPGPNVKPNEARWMLEHWTRLSCAVKDKLALIVSKDESKKVTKGKRK